MSIDVVRQVRSKYPTPLGSSHAAFLLELAPALTATHARDFGLLIKPGGTNILLPDGTRVSQDVVCDRQGIQIDCLMDGEGQAVPVWNHVDPAHYTPDPSRFYAVTGTPPPVDPDPPPTDVGSDVEELQAKVARLEQQVADLEGRVAHLEAQPAPPESLTVPQVQQLIQAELAPLSVSVGRNYGHGHSAALLGRKG